MFYEFLGPSSGSDDFADVIGLGVVDCVISEEDLLELLKRLVILRGDEPTWNKVYVFRIFMQSSMREMRSLTKASLFLTSLVFILFPSLL